MSFLFPIIVYFRFFRLFSFLLHQIFKRRYIIFTLFEQFPNLFFDADGIFPVAATKIGINAQA